MVFIVYRHAWKLYGSHTQAVGVAKRDIQKLPADNKHDHDMTSQNWQPMLHSSDSELFYIWGAHDRETIGCCFIQKGGVMQLRHARGCHMVFWKPIQPLQRVPRLACSVGSLSLYPGHQLLECYSLHCKTLAGYLLGKELPSAHTVTHSMQHCIPAPEVTA